MLKHLHLAGKYLHRIRIRIVIERTRLRVQWANLVVQWSGALAVWWMHAFRDPFLQCFRVCPVDFWRWHT